MDNKKIPPCSGHAYSNTIKCECCQSIIDLDDTDWCDKCDRSIFDDTPYIETDKDGNRGINYYKVMEYMYNWIRENSGK